MITLVASVILTQWLCVKLITEGGGGGGENFPNIDYVICERPLMFRNASELACFWLYIMEFTKYTIIWKHSTFYVIV